MAEEDNAAELLEQHPDDADDLEPQDEDQLEEHQGEDGSGDQWDLGQEADADFGVEVLMDHFPFSLDAFLVLIFGID